ncbi:hypothetical protein FA15DRAFT_585271 [Coprinopsis marcescibilis]|uniref:DUF221-domain-containing protein n=1 Tax=Coprinopsis marcescibilis TaxID=230819 RepID=A0A5C3L685_COPMA|nr:hypothetical protein FA15DRAFT_585271 [Coprinopsis marcescibilis]
MGDIQTRPFSKNYSGLINQTVIAVGITVLCVTGQELMRRRKRRYLARRQVEGQGLGSREAWEFGYLYNGRSWARFPSVPSPTGWPLLWVKQAIKFSEDELLKLRGIDAALYVRFLRGCFWFSLLHTLTTFPLLFPIHVHFAEEEIPSKSMTRASISSLVATEKGLSLLWIHTCLLFWIALSWIATLVWICNGAFRLRARSIEIQAAKRQAFHDNPEGFDTTPYQHPHLQYGFLDIPANDRNHPNYGLRLRTVMVSNVPGSLRDEKELKEYFEYWLSRKIEKPSMGLTSSTQPGFINKSLAFILNRAKRIPAHLPEKLLPSSKSDDQHGEETKDSSVQDQQERPVIERVVVARKMTELASLLERREDILASLEAAHIKLANKALAAVKAAMASQEGKKTAPIASSKAAEIARKRRSETVAMDLERGHPENFPLNEEDQLAKLIDVLSPFVREFQAEATREQANKKHRGTSKQNFRRLLRQSPTSSTNASDSEDHAKYPPRPTQRKSNEHETVWDALLSLPRAVLDPYQPLVSLNHLFRGKTVPAIDYYTAKLNLLTSLVTENRSKALTDFDPVSTAFVTFADPADATRACKYLAVHPNNPLACLVAMAPEYQDLDWIRVMKSTFHGEFLKDWIINIGVWGFTLFWLFPVSLLVGLVSIQNISLFWPNLKAYLDRHPWQSEVIQSFIPTLLVALLAILIPLILLLLAKKAHTITTLSALHDLIMTRYYKFLIVNVLVFFCVGTAAMQSVLQSFKNIANIGIVDLIADSFPTAGPFYIGWLIFTTAMHGGFELVLCSFTFQLPLLTYPGTSRQVAPRKRKVGTRPRTLNYYYWLPNHLLVIHILLVFGLLNPFVLPFGAIYFFVQSGIIKNQFIHVYAKHYEGNGKMILIRLVRYSLDGLTLSLVVFMAYMIVLKKKANLGAAAFLVIFTILVKLLMTRMCRAQFEIDDAAEAEALCGQRTSEVPTDPEINPDCSENSPHQEGKNLIQTNFPKSVATLRLPQWMNFSYNSLHQRPKHRYRRKPIPFNSIPVHQTETDPRAKPSLALPDQKSIVQNGFPWHDKPWHTSNSLPTTGVPVPTASMGPVVRHPRPLAWDDQDTVDLPYNNPYYSRAIDNVLWLPRNPTGVLDLDDTVDLKVALTVELSAGQLGSWLGLLQRPSPEEISAEAAADPHSSPSHIIAVSPPVSLASLPEVNGTEEIELPPSIMRRVKSGELGIEQATRPRKSTLSRRRSSTGDGTNSGTLLGPSRRRPSILNLPTMQSALDVNQAPVLRARSGSVLSALQLSPIIHSTPSSENEFGVRPDTHAQAELVVAMANGSKLSLGQKQTGSQILSAQQAIFHEILAEEEQALIERLQVEESETSKSKSTKSWLTSWMFRRGD